VTAAPAAPPDVGRSGTSTDPTAPELWRAAKGPVAVAVLVLLAGLLVALASGGADSRPLDPRSPTPGGGRALAEVLRDQGVRVDRLTSTAGLTDSVGRATTVLVVDPDLLTDDQVATLVNTGADLVLLSTTAPQRWVAGVGAQQVDPDVRSPGCRLPAARRAGPADAGLISYDVDGTALGTAFRCYPHDGRPALVQGRVDGRLVTLVGTAAGFTNSGLDDDGNAALALGLLGAHDRLVWLMPSPAGLPSAEQKSFYELVPDGVWWGLGQLAVAVLLLALWRARRLGPVVAEPLPVVVRAADAVEGRGRLYRRAGARDRAAEALRSGVRARLVPALGLPRRAEPPAVVTAVAARSSRPAVEVGALLYGAAPADDAALVRLADALDDLEREVRRP
jgi:hypothetical protein